MLLFSSVLQALSCPGTADLRSTPAVADFRNQLASHPAGTQVPETDSVLSTSYLQSAHHAADLRNQLALHPAGTQVPETDSVLATTELHELLEQHQVDLRSLEPSPFDAILPAAAGSGSSGSWAAAGDGAGWQADGSGSGSGSSTAAGSSGGSGAGTVPASSGSGGYLEYVFRAAALQLFGRQLPAGPLQTRVGRNAGALRP